MDISELTWEQKEQVLKLLFYKLNTSGATPTKSLPPIDPSPRQQQSPIFLTQTNTGGGGDTATGSATNLPALSRPVVAGTAS